MGQFAIFVFTKQHSTLFIRGCSNMSKKAAIKAVVVQFKDLHKIRSPLGLCEGFIMDDFDKLIEVSTEIT